MIIFVNMGIDEKVDYEKNIILKGPSEAREIRIEQSNRTLNNTDLAGKYFDLAKECEKRGDYKTAARFRRNARDARDGFRAYLD